MENTDLSLADGGQRRADSDPINHPQHYTRGTIETIEVIEDWGLNYHLGCVLKYLARYRFKGDAVADLHKALWYARRALRELEHPHPGRYSAAEIGEDWHLSTAARRALVALANYQRTKDRHFLTILIESLHALAVDESARIAAPAGDGA